MISGGHQVLLRASIRIGYPPKFGIRTVKPHSISRTLHQRPNTMASATSFYDFKPLDSKFQLCREFCHKSTKTLPIIEKGEPYPLADLQGKVVLVVNTASKCGFTPQVLTQWIPKQDFTLTALFKFDGLEKLYKSVTAAHPDSFMMLGFPCNQFNGQDPGENDTIQEFCRVNYGVSFPILGKTEVNGDKAEPVFEWMKKEKPGIMGLKRVKWNFEKFLIGADGQVKGRWASTAKPETLEGPILEELKKVGGKATAEL